jgi:hypothetical protein
MDMDGIEVVDCVLAEHIVGFVGEELTSYKSPGYIKVKCVCDCIIKIKEGKMQLCPNCKNEFTYDGFV